MWNRVTGFVRQYDRNLWILVFGWFVAALGFSSSVPFLAIYFHSQLGLSTSQIGIFFAAMAIIRSFFMLVGGELSDRFGRHKLLVSAQFLRAMSFAALGVVIYLNMGFWTICAIWTVEAVCGSLFMPSMNGLVSDLLPPERRLYGYALARSAANLGWAVGPAIGGFLAKTSYSSLFFVSAGAALASALVFRFFFKPPPMIITPDRFKLSDLVAIREDKHLATHAFLTFLLTLVMAQLIAPFSLYTVEIRGMTESDLGMLFTLNGLLVVLLQIPVTRLLRNQRLTDQLAWGGLLYFVGYGIAGFFEPFWPYVFVIMLITMGEVTLSPPSMTLTANLAPPGRIGRYMGIRGFCDTAGWSLGPLYGGVFLDYFADRLPVAWMLIASLALVSALGYFWFGRFLPAALNRHD